MDKKSLLADIRKSREAFETVLGRLTDAQMNDVALYDQWTPKDLLAHFSFWERYAANLVEVLTHGGTPRQIGSGEGLDEVNATVYESNHDRSLDAVRKEEQASYQFLIDMVEKTSEEDLMNPSNYAWTDGTPLSQIVEDNSLGHYTEHLPHLQTWIETN